MPSCCYNYQLAVLEKGEGGGRGWLCGISFAEVYSRVDAVDNPTAGRRHVRAFCSELNNRNTQIIKVDF